ncbi:hypothetical protein C8R44DRAFT_166026 [Mycena epipterygia]|nr:hypothetical protein C8R44DRAFT_166026 [Mycena epipterygia]
MDLQSEESYYAMGRTTPTPRRRIPRPLTPMPIPTTDAYEEVLSLDFVCRRKSRSILNCTVVSPDGCTPYFHIVTSSDVHPAQTFFRTNKGRTVAAVEWDSKGRGAYVEVHKTVAKQRVSEWLGVSGDASYRMMYAYGQSYVWVPQSNSICMYHWSPSTLGDIPHLLARIEKEDRKVRLEITLEAVNRGLLEMVVVATTLFQSGCCID